jgi:D-alanyl-lipoteichoic acid acyltransferase DltB (MBOAT superfamily)
MLFNSAQFLFGFLPVALSVFLLLGSYGHRMLAIGWLAMASLVFYGWDDPLRLLPIILSSTAFNFIIGRMLVRKPNRGVLAFGIFGNLLLLGYFKYVGFLAEILTTGTGIVVPNPNVVLPIGISFFTFTQIAFLVDAYRSQAREYEPLHYVLFVTFFPHLIAGPIYHHKEIMPQFERREIYRFDISNLTYGLTWFALGLAKKVLLADPVAQYGAPVFAAAAAGAPVGFADGWIAALSFTLQLYFDFSGYSDMAIGLALLIGVRLPLNFDSPYKATSIIDFWRRWHMTLSRFLRDYLYIPLGGNRKGPYRRYVNLLVTMLLGGLWHGAAWNFLIWGGIHGAGLMINHLWRNVAQTRNWVIPSSLAWAITFAFVVLAWIPFRADGVHAAVSLWKGMIGVNGFLAPEGAAAGQFAVALGWIGALLALALIGPNTQQLMSYSGVAVVDTEKPGWRPSLRWGAVAGILFGASVLSIVAQRPTEFLYFRF